MDAFDQIFRNDSVAIIFNNQAISYSKLRKKILSVEKYLSDNNVKNNDRAIILGKNSSDFIILVLALWKIGAVPIPLNFNLTENEYNNLIDIISPKVVFLDAGLNYTVELKYRKYINYPFEYENIVSNEKLFFNSDLSKTALIIFTSGSSGKSKGVKLSFSNLFKSAQSQNKFLGLNQNDKYLVTLPFYHIGGFSIITRTLFSGGTIVIPNSIKNENVIEAIYNYDPSSISIVPTQLKRMIEYNFTPPDYLKNVLLGGSFIDNNLITEAVNKGWKLIKVYGSTETCSFIIAQIITSSEDITNSLDKVIGNNEIKIINGQISVKGESVMQGYLNKKTDFTLDGFFVTEDTGYFNENNELIIEGRRGDIIISGGENISLKEIENYVKKFEKIKDVVVLGMKDNEWGKIVTVAVVTFENELFPLSQLNNFLSDKIAKFKLPKKIFFVDEIPRNEMGKVLKEKLLGIINH